MLGMFGVFAGPDPDGTGQSRGGQGIMVSMGAASPVVVGQAGQGRGLGLGNSYGQHESCGEKARASAAAVAKALSSGRTLQVPYATQHRMHHQQALVACAISKHW